MKKTTKPKKKKKDKSERRTKPSRYLLLLVVAFISVLMISSSFALLAEYSRIIESEAGEIALQYVESTANHVRSGVEYYKQKSRALANKVKSGSYENEREFLTKLGRYRREGDYGDILYMRYYKDGKEYNVEGEEFDTALEAESVLRTVQKGVNACAGVVADRQYSVSAAAFVAPIDSFEYADALIVFYPVESMTSYSSKIAEADYSNSIHFTVCTTGGEIVKMLNAEKDTGVQPHADIYTILRKDLSNKELVDTVVKKITAGEAEYYPMFQSGETRVLSVAGISDNDNPCFSVIGYYRAADIYKSGYFIIRVVLGQFIIYFSLVLIGAIYGIIAVYRNRRLIMTMNDTNVMLDCPTRIKFERVTGEIIARNKATAFAIAVMDIDHYEYLMENLGNETMLKVLLNVKTVLSKLTKLDETYGYLENGRFAVLFHYREEKDLQDRLLAVTSFVTQQSAKIANNTSIVQIGGVYQTPRNLTDSVTKMVDLAIDAEKAVNLPYDFGAFRIYNETMYASTVMNEYVEVHMESALQNHDFKVFYQPKYNIAGDHVDGCEALVRWYNPERDEYMQPGVFLPLFEANRFILKLDHYVYEQVLIYIEDSVINGMPLVPVSVNVSRITAIDSDFVNYYTELKKKHNIADNFITIEFTESFAYEDYDMLRDTVVALHKNGFKCAIDDFGTGFSSYQILKELPMDEIKLDRIFIADGFSKERDLTILSSIIKLGRDLRMKVTQEGVEFGDQVELLRKLGCQVTQGYHYSKPLSLTDFVSFLDNQRISSIIIKSED